MKVKTSMNKQDKGESEWIRMQTLKSCQILLWLIFAREQGDGESDCIISDGAIDTYSSVSRNRK